jgi:hypothetical protein
MSPLLIIALVVTAACLPIYYYFNHLNDDNRSCRVVRLNYFETVISRKVVITDFWEVVCTYILPYIVILGSFLLIYHHIYPPEWSLFHYCMFTFFVGALSYMMLVNIIYQSFKE